MMGTVKRVSETIDGIKYTAQTFPASEALILGARLARLVPQGSTWHEFLAVTPDKLPLLFANPLVALDGLIAAAKENPPEEFPALAKDLLSSTECANVNESGAPGPLSVHFDMHFAGRIGHLFKVLVWSGRVGFGGSWSAPSSSAPRQVAAA